MVEPDRSDYCDVSVGDVGRVPRPAHADLNHGDVDRCVGKRDVRHRHEHLEAAQRGGEFRVDQLEIGRELVVNLGEPPRCDLSAVDLDRLGHTRQLGARE